MRCACSRNLPNSESPGGHHGRQICISRKSPQLNRPDPFCTAEVGSRAGRIGREPHRLAVLRRRVVDAAQALERRAVVVAGVGRVGREADGRLVGRGRARVVAGAIPRVAQRQVGRG